MWILIFKEIMGYLAAVNFLKIVDTYLAVTSNVFMRIGMEAVK